MRKIITATFVTLDGVMQAPGGPEEDTSHGFAYGGWQFSEDWGSETVAILDTFTAAPFDLLLGRLTYDIWVGFWPAHADEPRFGKPFDKAKKFVVSHQPVKLAWDNSELITGDVVTQIKKLKASAGPDLWVWGSGNLIQTLLKNHLIDRMHVLTFPLTIGSGKKLFAEGTQPEHFKAVDSKVTSTGVVFVTYEPAEPLRL